MTLSPEFLLLQAEVAGRYSLDRELGRGGMGVVFLAREVSLDRLVAIKLLPPALVTNTALRERFLREARTAAQLSHPHIVSIHAVESHAEVVFFVMEYVPGETLGERLRVRGALPTAEALRIVQEVSWAIAHAHARGVIHRDIKPDNILLEEGSDRAIVTDFGIAFAGDGDTPVGTAMGTMHYMSPEQATGASADVRGDVYALGVTAYYALSGRRPFEGAEGMALLAQQSGSEAPLIRSLVPSLAPAVAGAIDRALASDPAERWSTVEEFTAALASARALVPQAPVVLRRFARHAVEHGDRFGIVLGASASAGVAVLLIDAFTRSNFLSFEEVPFMIVAALGMGFASLLLGIHVDAIRRTAGAGYTRAAALRAVAQVESELEELPRRFEKSSNDLWDRGVAVNGIGVGVTLLSIWAGVQAESVLTFVPAMLLALLAPVVTVRRLIQLHGAKGSWWGRVLRSGFGAKLWQLSTIGLRRVREAPTSGEPTALALGGAIHRLYGELPEGEQRLLAEVPALIDQLEARALDRADPHSVEAVMALETLRLDLMKLRAGQIAADGLTTEFGKLREVGWKVDAVEQLGERRPANSERNGASGSR